MRGPSSAPITPLGGPSSTPLHSDDDQALRDGGSRATYSWGDRRRLGDNPPRRRRQANVKYSSSRTDLGRSACRKPYLSVRRPANSLGSVGSERRPVNGRSPPSTVVGNVRSSAPSPNVWIRAGSFQQQPTQLGSWHGPLSGLLIWPRRRGQLAATKERRRWLA